MAVTFFTLGVNKFLSINRAADGLSDIANFTLQNFGIEQPRFLVLTRLIDYENIFIFLENFARQIPQSSMK